VSLVPLRVQVHQRHYFIPHATSVDWLAPVSEQFGEPFIVLLFRDDAEYEKRQTTAAVRTTQR
jgi:hypothetical protein